MTKRLKHGDFDKCELGQRQRQRQNRRRQRQRQGLRQGVSDKRMQACCWCSRHRPTPRSRLNRWPVNGRLQPKNIHLTKRRGICADHQASFYIECMRWKQARVVMEEWEKPILRQTHVWSCQKIKFRTKWEMMRAHNFSGQNALWCLVYVLRYMLYMGTIAISIAYKKALNASAEYRQGWWWRKGMLQNTNLEVFLTSFKKGGGQSHEKKLQNS